MTLTASLTTLKRSLSRSKSITSLRSLFNSPTSLPEWDPNLNLSYQISLQDIPLSSLQSSNSSSAPSSPTLPSYSDATGVPNYLSYSSSREPEVEKRSTAERKIKLRNEELQRKAERRARRELRAIAKMQHDDSGVDLMSAELSRLGL